tara:strand:- start:7718 stop:8071 length:354 start_codon:yes stop_codon:yes gene_type:complete
MTFSKTFPKTVKGSNYPQWEEIFLTKDEEHQVEEDCRIKNNHLFEECIFDAKQILQKKGLGEEQLIINTAIALFEKRASHVVFLKESKAKEKFDFTQQPVPSQHSPATQQTSQQIQP